MLSVDVHAGRIGNGHKAALLELSLGDDCLMRFALVPEQLKQLLEKGHAQARLWGLQWDQAYRPLVCVAQSLGANGHGHTKPLPTLPLPQRSGQASLGNSNSEIRNPKDSDFELRTSNLPGSAGPSSGLGQPARADPVYLSAAELRAAFQQYCQSASGLDPIARALRCSPATLSSRFIAVLGFGYVKRARRARRLGPEAIQELLAIFDEGPARKPSGRIL